MKYLVSRGFYFKLVLTANYNKTENVSKLVHYYYYQN